MDENPLKPAEGMIANQLNELLGHVSTLATHELNEIKKLTENLQSVVSLMVKPDKP